MSEACTLEEYERRLRQMIGWRDRMAHEVARLEGEIAVEARAYANATGVKVRPTIDQLRWQLNKGGGS